MGGWNFANVWEVVAERLPDAPAQVQGDRRLTWAEFDWRADGVARFLLDEGAGHQDKVALYLTNCPEYLEAMFAAFKASLVPVNTNYRYGPDELVYLWDNADAVAVVFHGTFAERVAEVRPRVPNVRHWVWVDDGSGPCPEWAVPYEDAAATPTGGRTFGPWGRSDDDLMFVYTGGTTGMPKGVMWRQDDLYAYFSQSTLHDPVEYDEDHLRRRLAAAGPAGLPACPLMHGTGCFVSMITLSLGGPVVTLPSRAFDVVELLDTIQREQVRMLVIVGDAFAKPMLRALDEQPGRFDISSLVAITSSGVMFSETTKQGLLRHHAGMVIIDVFSSSEALGMGTSISGAGTPAPTARFQLGEKARVVTPDGRDVVPGSGEAGLVAVAGPCPVGYYKDPEKTEATFRVIDGVRYSVPGDWATVEPDGTLRLLGRGSVCINTGGEKVFPEEVEEVLKEHPAVRDAVVVGVPDDRFGEAICALVEPDPGAAVDEDDVIAHVKGRLASYKAPRRVLTVDTVGRSPAGKVDYGRLRREAAERVGPAAG